MKVSDLIEMLEDCDPNAEVRLAIQPNYPFEHSVDAVEEIFSADGPSTVYIAEGGQVDYLSGEARDALGWGR